MFVRDRLGVSPHTAPLGYEFTSYASRITGFRAAIVLPRANRWDQIHTISAAVGGSAPLRETVIAAARAA
ncbi:hypothetical protein GCM10023214_31360 [Amycolatopsis dongchuanensis]|uniref:Uncharacterized protein n=1 Tax=Amycolatopsis dongchuanensis TaxID=1070866 RepID=A0ABP9QK63_9PSEU